MDYLPPPEAPPLAPKWVVLHRISLVPVLPPIVCRLTASEDCLWAGAAIGFGAGPLLGAPLLLALLALIPLGIVLTFALSFVRLRGLRGLVAPAATAAERQEALLLGSLGLLFLMLLAH